jgi:choline transport protein
MNYVSVVLGIFIVLLSGIWLGYGKRYQGPEFGVILGVGADMSHEQSYKKPQ